MYKWRYLFFFLWLFLNVLPMGIFLFRGTNHDAFLLLGFGLLAVPALLQLIILTRSQSKKDMLLAAVGNMKVNILLGMMVLAFVVGVITVSLVFALAMTAGCVNIFVLSFTGTSNVAQWRSRIRRTLLVLCGITIGIGLCETVLRIPRIAAHCLVPEYVRRSNWGKGYYDVTAWTRWSNTTFRSFHLNEPTTTNCLTIVTVGDSYTWGDKIANTSNLWPYVMERALLTRGINSRVINLACRSDTTVNEVEKIFRYAGYFDPDLIIIQYTLNDPLPSNGLAHVDERWMKPRPVFFLSISYRLHKVLEKHSFAYSLASEWWRRALNAILGIKDKTYFDIHDDAFYGWKDATNAMRELSIYCCTAHIPCFAIIIPSFGAKGLAYAEYTYTSIHNKVKHAFEHAGIPCLDLRDKFDMENPRDWWATPTDGHPSVLAHRVIGEAVEKYLVESANVQHRVYNKQKKGKR